jgi:hypothetical protein
MQISFQGPTAGKFDGSLQLKNVDAGDSFEYGLVGLADEVILTLSNELLKFSIIFSLSLWQRATLHTSLWRASLKPSLSLFTRY